MNKTIFKIFSAALAISLLIFPVSCRKEEDNSMNKIEDIVTQKYDLQVLSDYFDGHNANETVLSKEPQFLYFTDINREFSVQTVRPGGYTVYAVEQGGYYYVFWSNANAKSVSDLDEGNLYVYFSAYIFDAKNALLFESLKIGESTAADVREIDPYFELSFLISNGIYSYSFLNNESILQIEYMSDGKISNYSDLIVKSTKILSRKDSPSKYGSILADDLPC